MTTPIMSICEGECNQCSGEVKLYVCVSPKTFKGMEFTYCDHAVGIDREGGFEFKEVLP